MANETTTTLWRPVGQAELDLIAETEFRRFPPRLLGQPIFYPVCNEAYAVEITEKWNARDEGVGYVTRFDVKTAFLEKYPIEVVGAAHHAEHWIPAEQMEAFNDAIVGTIVVVGEYRTSPD